MTPNLLLRTVVALLAVASWFIASFFYTVQAQTVSRDRFWQHVDKLPAAPANARVDIQPTKFATFTLNAGLLRSTLAKAPVEFTVRAPNAEVQITLPMPDGTFARFQIEESSVMAPELAAKFLEIKSYAGRGIDDPSAKLRLDINSRTFHAQILSPNGAIYIDPYWHLDGRLYMSYAKSDLARDTERFKCLVDAATPDPDLSSMFAPDNSGSGKTLRTYRLACATSMQYSLYHSAGVPTVPEVMAALVTMVNRVSGIYENELAIRMVLVANNDQIIATPTNPGPYTDTPGDIELNPAYCDQKIGAANYDIGHVVTVGSGGVAGLGVVCRGLNVTYAGSLKAAGTTGFDPPVNDPFWVDYVAHEMGHQFGGNHTFNGNGTNCGAANQNASTAYEPGSGSTIQAYAGICGVANNLQSNSDPYFHFVSMQEIWNYTNTGSGNGCPVKTTLSNNPPTVTSHAPGIPVFPAVAYKIPDQTPFALTAFDGADPESDPITYSWEEADIGPEKAGNAPDNGSSALFRSFNPTPNPTRTFPRWSDLLANNTQTIGEKLPLTTRKLDFKVTVRDNRGGFGTDTIKLNVVDTGNGFKVTTPNTTVTYAGGSTQTVTWDVAGTTANGINTSNVDILLTTDATGEPSFPIVLAANTPNDGSQTVTMPLVNTTKARVKIAAVGNVYFDISDVNFTITGPTPVTLVETVSRKTHGSTGDFDLSLPVSAPYAIECRSGGANGDYMLVFTFSNPLTNVSSASVSSGAGSIASSNIGANAAEYIVNLTGVTNAQAVTVSLSNVQDLAGNQSASVTATMSVLLGDTSADGSVNSADIGQTKSQSGNLVSGSNFRQDVTVDGNINSADIGLVKSKSGTALP